MRPTSSITTAGSALLAVLLSVPAFAQTPAHKAATRASEIVGSPLILQPQPRALTETARLVQMAAQLKLEQHHLEYSVDTYKTSLQQSQADDRASLLSSKSQFDDTKNRARLNEISNELAELSKQIELSVINTDANLLLATPHESLKVIDRKSKNRTARISFYDPKIRSEAGPTEALLNLPQQILSAPQKLKYHRFLQEPIEALQRKLEILTGSKVPREVLEKTDASFKMDMSKAPHLKRVLISTLYIANDFTGKMLATALKFHADRGTAVYILASKAAYFGFKTSDPDGYEKSMKLLEWMQAPSNKAARSNLQLQMVAFNEPELDEGKSPRFTLNELIAAHHAKIMIFEESPSEIFGVGDNGNTVGKIDTTTQKVIIGGRNLSDNYVFSSAPDLSRFPDLIQYNPATYQAVEDLDVELQSSPLAQSAAAQFMAFWDRDKNTNHVAPVDIHLASSGLSALQKIKLEPSLKSDNGVIRHMLSIPFFKSGEPDQATHVFVKLIDSAKKSLLISTPYFHPVEQIASALRRAQKRGVKIRVVTNVDFSRDDFLPSVVTAVNQQSIAKLKDIGQFYVWNQKGELFHSKTLLVDEQVLYMGSFNLNNRSFLHDIENGVLFTSPKIASDYLQLFTTRFLPQSRPLTDADLVIKPSMLNVVKSIFPEFF